MNIKQVAKLIELEFRKYEFNADKVRIIQDKDRANRFNGAIKFEFEDEIAKGQIAFSQKRIKIHAILYVPEITTKIPNTERENIELPARHFKVTLGTDYIHHTGGRNGVTRDYVLIDNKLISHQDYLNSIET